MEYTHHSDRVEAEPRIDVEHVARAVVYMASLPLDANVQFMTVMATKIPISAAAEPKKTAGYISQQLHPRLGHGLP